MIWKGLLYYIIIFKYLEHHIYVYLFKKNQHRVLDLTWHYIVRKYKTCPQSFDFSDSMYRWPLMRLYLPREYFRHPLPYSCDWDQPIQRQIILAHVYCFPSFSKVLARKKNFNVLKCKKDCNVLLIFFQNYQKYLCISSNFNKHLSHVYPLFYPLVNCWGI